MIPVDDFDPEIGTPQALELGLRRIVAPNPSPMTYRGTNTYIVGTQGLAVIDPGPQSPDHLSAVLDCVGAGQHISHIIVTHTHLDHSPLARALADVCGAPVFAFGGPDAGRSAVMTDLAASGLTGGGEGIDHTFTPDNTLAHGDTINGDGWTLDVIHTPGHIGNHICLGWGDACLTADHVMGWASSLVSPPDGDLTDFMASCATLANKDWRVFYPGHGGPIADPAGRLRWLVDHRKARETAILQALGQGSATAAELAQVIYTETPAALMGAATRNVLAHLIDLTAKAKVRPAQTLREDAVFKLI